MFQCNGPELCCSERFAGVIEKTNRQLVSWTQQQYTLLGDFASEAHVPQSVPWPREAVTVRLTSLRVRETICLVVSLDGVSILGVTGVVEVGGKAPSFKPIPAVASPPK